MTLRWEDERYVRLYTRDTVGWNMLPWQSRALLPLLCRKVDRVGVLEIGSHGTKGLASTVGLPINVTEQGLKGLVSTGAVVISNGTLLIPNFLKAQDTPSSDAQRKRDQRERARASLDTPGEDKGLVCQTINVTKRDEMSRGVTSGHAESRAVTRSHAESRDVTPNLTVPNRTLHTSDARNKAADTTPLVKVVSEKFSKLYGWHMLDGYQLSKASELIQAYAEITDLTTGVVLDRACAAFSELLAGWSVKTPPTISLFISKWVDIQAKMVRPETHEDPTLALKKAELKAKYGE